LVNRPIELSFHWFIDIELYLSILLVERKIAKVENIKH